MNIFTLLLKRFFPLIFLALFALTACGGGGGGGGGGSSAAADDTPDEDMPMLPPPPPAPSTFSGNDIDFLNESERVAICAAWTDDTDMEYTPHTNRGGEARKVTFASDAKTRFCTGGTPNRSLFSTSSYKLCYTISGYGTSQINIWRDIESSGQHYKVVKSPLDSEDYVALTYTEMTTLCGGRPVSGDGNDYQNGYLSVGEMRAVNLPSSVNRNQPALEILRQSSISLSHLFQRGVMQDNRIQTHDEFGNEISFSPLQAQSIKASYGLSDAMHDLTFSAKEDEIFSNEQANLAFTTNKYDSGQSNFNANYHLGNMFISGDFRPMMKESEMQFMQISDTASNVGTLGISHKLGDRITFTQKAGAGTLNTGNRFDEIATALAYSQGDKKLAIGAGRLREYDQFLGSVTTGAYALDEATESAFVSLHADMALGKNITMQANYSAMNSAVSMHHDDFVRVTSLRSDSYDVKLQSKMKRGNLSLQYLVPLAVTDGTWQQRNVVNLQDSISRQNLGVNDRHQQWSLRYQSNTNVFATLTRDENYSNISGLESTEIMAGLSRRF